MEYALVGYTVFMQLAAGLALVIWLSGLDVSGTNGRDEKTWWLMVFGTGCLGVLSSILHLHDVFHAPYTITQVGHAWMSREILLTGLFMLLALLRTANLLKRSFDWLPALSGLALVLAMAQIYTQNQAMPLWNHAGTWVSFLTAMCVLGGFGGIALHTHLNPTKGDLCLSIRLTGETRLCLAAILLSTPFLLIQPVFWAVTLSGEAFDDVALASFSAALVPLSLLQAVAVALAGALAALLPRNRLTAWLAFLLALAGILVGRSLFYTAAIKTGFQLS